MSVANQDCAAWFRANMFHFVSVKPALVFGALKLLCNGFVASCRFRNSDRVSCPVCGSAEDTHN